MSKITNFCPLCGSKTELLERFGKLRPVCTQCGNVVFFDPKVAVVVFITQGDRVLLVKRANDPGKGRWALPAGFVDAEEDPRTAARREVLEETGLQANVGRLIDVLYSPPDEGIADIVIVYAASVISGTLLANDDAEAVAWFQPAEMPELVFITTARLIRRWLDGELG